MTRSDIKAELERHHRHFLERLREIPDSEFTVEIAEDKWTPAQQLDHIRRSAGGFNVGLMMPKTLMRFFFGTADGSSRSYDQLVSDYQKVLDEGGTATAKYLPASVNLNQRQQLCTELEKITDNLTTRLMKLRDEDMDRYRLPHPLLGKISLREMFYFTIYHVQHHERQLDHKSAS